MDSRTGRGPTGLRPLQTTFEGLARVDGSARFAFGTTAALASISGPIEVRLASENPSLATFEVTLRPLSNVPTTQSKSLASTIRGALLPSLILTQNPRTLIQLTIQALSKSTPNTPDALIAAMLNASTLALLNAGSIPMRSIVCAVAVGLTHTNTLVVDPTENDLPTLAAHGCFAFSFTQNADDAKCVWTNYRSASASARGFDVAELEGATRAAKKAAGEVWVHIRGACRGAGQSESDGSDEDDEMVVS